MRAMANYFTSIFFSLCSTHRKLEAGLGFHTYVSCAVDGDSLAITSYFNPEIYYDH